VEGFGHQNSDVEDADVEPFYPSNAKSAFSFGSERG
jgi:hypothetical protein